MDILMVAAELGPYARATEAADTVAGLGKALRQLGHEVVVALPRYPHFEDGGLLMARRLTPLTLEDGTAVAVLDGQLSSGVKIVLFDAPELFDRPGIYGEDGGSYADSVRRFGLLGKACVALIGQHAAQGQPFDVVHAHDWPGALATVLIDAMDEPRPPTVLTIHDVSRIGTCTQADLASVLPPSVVKSGLFKVGTRSSILRGGILRAGALTTVSPTYAADVQREEHGGPVAEALASRRDAIFGITNGLDYSIFNPATDPALPARYDAEEPSSKGSSKTAVMRELGLELATGRALAVALGPLTKDGGFSLLKKALPAFLKNDLAVIIGGEGRLAKSLGEAARRAPGQLVLVNGSDAALERRLYAAADLVLAPAPYDPSGTWVRRAQRYGAVPVARAAGGVVDAVVDCDVQLETGTGFLFDGDEVEDLVGAVQRALAAYRSPGWYRLRRRIMSLDLGWDRPARRYLQVYRQLARRAAPPAGVPG